MDNQIVNYESSGSIDELKKEDKVLEPEIIIKDVWAHNLYEEFAVIRHLIPKFDHIAMDTEFPGFVARPIGEFKSYNDYAYRVICTNVDLLQLIQLGLTLMDENGNLPLCGVGAWQFNFKFNLDLDHYAYDSIELLKNSGLDFEKHEKDGIDPFEFSELFIASGLVLNDDIKWLSFHSGFDFGYLLKTLLAKKLPANQDEFFGLLKLFFPVNYDVKYLVKSCKTLHGGLQELAWQLGIKRVGRQHQAGSDSLVTGLIFFKLKEMFFENYIDDEKFNGHLFGLDSNFLSSSTDLSNYFKNEK